MGEILFIGHRVPFPPDRGDKIRSHHILRELARLAPVHVACFADDDVDLAQAPALAELAASHCLVRRSRALPLAGLVSLARRQPVSLAAFADRRLHAYVRAVLRTRPISAIYVFSGQMGHYAPEDFTGRLVVDLVDVDSAKFGAYAQVANRLRRWLFGREERLLRAEEARLAACADVTLLVSDEEAALLRARLPNGTAADVRALRNGIDTGCYDPAAVAPEPLLAGAPGPALIFTGQMDYPPNVAAVERAVRRIMPLVRADLPRATFHIVGRQPTAAVRALDGVNGSRVHGAVADVRPWLKGSALALIPLDLARGVQNKVLEAMAMALPVVASPAAATGVPARHGIDLVVAESDRQIAAAVVALLREPERAAAIGGAARALVLRECGWAAALRPLGPLIGMAPAGAERVPDAA